MPRLKERYINSLGVMHNAVIVPVRATRCRYQPRAWVWVRLAWPGSAAQGKPRRRQAGQAVALRRPGKTRKVSPGFEKYCMAAMITYAPKGLRLQSSSFTLQMPRSNRTLFPKLSVISTLAVRNSVQRTGSQSKCMGS